MALQITKETIDNLLESAKTWVNSGELNPQDICSLGEFFSYRIAQSASALNSYPRPEVVDETTKEWVEEDLKNLKNSAQGNYLANGCLLYLVYGENLPKRSDEEKKKILDNPCKAFPEIIEDVVRKIRAYKKGGQDE